MNKKLLVLLLALMLACADKPEAQRDATGVAIQEFKPDLDEVRAGNNAILRLKAQNVGDTDAKKVEATIYKCGNLLVDSGKCPRKYSLGDLSSADTPNNLPGGEAEKIFTLSTSNVKNAENERLAQEIGLKVSYGYESSATAEIPVLSNARYKELERDGKLPSAKTESSFAPIRASITAPPQAVGTAYINLDIGLENLMGGYAEGSGCTNRVGCIDSVKIAVSGKGIAKQDCSDRGGTELWRTGKRTFTCTLRPDCNEGECYPVVKVTAKYTYVTERTTTLAVIGTPGAGAGGAAPTPPPEEQKSTYDVISLSPAKGYAPQEITVTGINFSKADNNIHLYIEGDKYWIENKGEGLRRQKETGWVLAKLIPIDPASANGAQSPDGFGITPAASGEYGTFKAKFKIPHAIADSASGAIAKAFASGDANKDRAITATEGYSNAQNLEIEPKAKTTASPPEAQSGQGVTVSINGEKYPPAQQATIYLLKPECANYFGEPAIDYACAKQIAQRTTDAAGTFSYSFTLDQAFMDANKAYSGYYLVFAKAAGIEDTTALNGAGEFTILFGAADADKDGVPDSLDQCPNTPIGAIVCSTYDAAQAGECQNRAGCEKLPVERTDYSPTDTIVALKIKSDETTGDYAITYDDTEPYKFLVKKNGVKATLLKQDLASIPRGSDMLFVFKAKNTATTDITDQMDVKVRGLTTDDLPTQSGHCMGITLQAGKDETCALLKTNIWANNYVTELKITKGGNDYIKPGFSFTVN